MAAASVKQSEMAKLLISLLNLKEIDPVLFKDAKVAVEFIEANKASLYCSNKKIEFVKNMALRLGLSCPNLGRYDEITAFLDKHSAEYFKMFPRLKKGLA